MALSRNSRRSSGGSSGSRNGRTPAVPGFLATATVWCSTCAGTGRGRKHDWATTSTVAASGIQTRAAARETSVTRRQHSQAREQFHSRAPMWASSTRSERMVRVSPSAFRRDAARRLDGAAALAAAVLHPARFPAPRRAAPSFPERGRPSSVPCAQETLRASLRPQQRVRSHRSIRHESRRIGGLLLLGQTEEEPS